MVDRIDRIGINLVFVLFIWDLEAELGATPW
jgi:hypothetical protein